MSFVRLSFVILAIGACGDNGAAPTDAAVASPDAPPDATPPPPPPGITFFDYAIAVDVSPDGGKAVFEDLSTAVVRVVTVDTVTGALGVPVDVGDPSLDLVTGVAGNGRLSAIHGNPAKAGLYDPTTMSWHDLTSPYPTSCDPNVSGGFDVDGDGTVMVGLLWNGCTPVAFRWTDGPGDGTVMPLQIVGASSGSGSPTNRATVVSDDGTVAAGFAENLALDRSAAIWDASGHGTLIDAVQQDAPSEILSINRDGSVVAGTFGYDAFAWTAAGGSVAIPRPDASLPSDPQFPNAITGDGAVVFGGVGDPFQTVPIAFVWSQAAGTRVLADVVTAAGIAMPTGTVLDSVLGVSSDGTVLAGTATDAAGASKTFLLRLPASAIH